MKRSHSFWIIFGIYLSAFIVGVVVYRLLELDSMIARVIIADLAATVTIFLFSTAFKNSSVYDPYWSVAPMVIVPFFVETWNVASVLMVVVIGYWGIRLTLNWAVTFKGLAHEDWRYRYFKARFPRLWPLVNLFGIHLMPTVVVILVMLPALLYLQSSPYINLITLTGAFLSMLATTIQWHSDHTVHRFREHTPEYTCKVGLWKYSRHPNYFGEILMWFGVFLMLYGVRPSYYLSILGPLLNMAMFIAISIPLMEKRELKRKKDYEAYIENTNMLLPLPDVKTLRETVLGHRK
ncbi:MAG: DUF1295 domain-containing protein [Bacillota bacterium]